MHILSATSAFPKHYYSQEMLFTALQQYWGDRLAKPEVPDLARRRLGNDVDRFLADLGRDRGEVGSWVLHTGGPRVLQATASAQGLENGQLSASWDCLRRVGNLSSASAQVVLEDVMKNKRPEPGTLGVLAAMGSGFCSELVALEW
jgi:alkylresorcinol/alkylpyrone synthase